MSRPRTSSAADLVRESIDRLRTLPLEDVDKELYELSLKAEEKAAAEVRANLGISTEDNAAITAVIQEVESELQLEESKKQFERKFLGFAICGLILAYSFYSSTSTWNNHRKIVAETVQVVVDFLSQVADFVLKPIGAIVNR